MCWEVKVYRDRKSSTGRLVDFFVERFFASTKADGFEFGGLCNSGELDVRLASFCMHDKIDKYSL